MTAFIYFAHAAVIVFGLVTLLWAISIAVRDASLIDIFWGFGFALVGAACLYLVDPISPYFWLMGLMPILWGLRLTAYLAMRNLGHGEDERYTAMQKRAAKNGLSEMGWRLRSIFTIYWGQAVLIMIISAPVWVAFANGQSVEIGIIAIIGGLMWLTGTLFEAIGDAQLTAFKKKHADYDGPYEDKPVLNSGLWRYTRHPNYFGNALLWWGIFVASLQAPYGWTTVFAPIIMTILLTRVSGRDLLERKLKKRPKYREYVARTSSFIPLPPKDRVELEPEERAD